MSLPTTQEPIETGLDACHMLIYGPVGAGKTRFIGSLYPKALFISTDRGTREFSYYRVEVKSFEKVLSVLKEVEKKSSRYDAVVLDHLTDIQQMVEQYVCTKLKCESIASAGFGKGWKALTDTYARFKAQLLHIGLPVAFIAHVRQTKVKFGAREIDQIRPKLGVNCYDAFVPSCQFVGYLTSERVKTTNGYKKRRKLYFKQTDELEVKDRLHRKKSDSGFEWVDDPTVFIKSLR